MKKKQIEQCSYLNLSTSAEELKRTFNIERPAAQHYLCKYYGGKHRFEKKLDEMISQAMERKESMVGDLVEYISPRGNRWMSYLDLRYYKLANYVEPLIVSFVYYETYGSCGAFFYHKMAHTTHEIPDNAMFITFTSHFFLRLSERTGIPFRSRELVKEMATTMNQQAMQTFPDGEALIKFRDGYGLGIVRSGSPMSLEIRTYLNRSQMTKAQLKRCDDLDSYSTLVDKGLLRDDILTRIINNKELSNEELKYVFSHMAPVIDKVKKGVDVTIPKKMCDLFLAALYRVTGTVYEGFNRRDLHILHVAGKHFMRLYSETENETNKSVLIEKYLDCSMDILDELHSGGITREAMREAIRQEMGWEY